MSLTLLLPYKILARFVPDCDHDKLYTQALFRTFIYLLPSRKSYYLLSFCTIHHFVRVAVTFSFFFLQMVDIIFGMKPITAFHHGQAYHCLFSLPRLALCPFGGPGAGPSDCQAARIRRVHQG